jgi:hypothetical protein
LGRHIVWRFVKAVLRKNNVDMANNISHGINNKKGDYYEGHYYDSTYAINTSY